MNDDSQEYPQIIDIINQNIERKDHKYLRQCHSSKPIPYKSQNSDYKKKNQGRPEDYLRMEDGHLICEDHQPCQNCTEGMKAEEGLDRESKMLFTKYKIYPVKGAR